MKHIIRIMMVLLVIGLCVVPEGWAYDYVDPSTMKDRMYKTIDGLPCVRLIGNSGPIGCTTGEGGAIGWLYAIETQAHISEFLSLSGVDGKAIAFMAPSVFQRENVISLVETNQIAGIIVYHGEPYASYQSPDSTYPNSMFGLYKNPTYKWNPQGNGWLFEKQNVPIFYVDANTTQELLPLARLNKEKGFPKWAAKLSAWMMTTYDQDSETCLRRDNCDPVGGKNVWGSFNPPSTFKKDKIVFVSASQDSNAFFHDLAPGAAANIADVAALVGAMEALRHIDRKTFTKQIVFGLFTGESWGFIGSKAFVKDIQGFECTTQPSPDYCSFPYRSDTNFTYVDINNIDSFIQLDQIGTVTSDNAEAKQLYFHFDPDYSTPDQIITALKSAALPLDVVASKSSVSQIPPSSVMSFMKARKDIPSLVLSNYDKSYVNEYYHSSFDDLSNVDMQRVCDVSSILARTIFSLATDSDQKVTLPEGFGANCTFTTALLQCFSGSFDCPLFTEYYYAPDDEVPETTNYAGVYRKSHVSINSKFLFDIMSNITARHHYEACNKTSECLAAGATCVAHRCITGPTVYYHDALSPGLEYQNGRYVVVDSSEPLWTEASWHSTYIQLFEMSNPSKDVAILSLGVAECLLCFVTVYFGRKLLRKRFKMA